MFSFSTTFGERISELGEDFVLDSISLTQVESNQPPREPAFQWEAVIIALKCLLIPARNPPHFSLASERGRSGAVPLVLRMYK